MFVLIFRIDLRKMFHEYINPMQFSHYYDITLNQLAIARTHPNLTERYQQMPTTRQRIVL